MNRYRINQRRGSWQVLDTFSDDRVVGFGMFYFEARDLCAKLNAESIADRDGN